MKRLIWLFLLIPFLAHALEFFPVAKFSGRRAILLKDGVGYYYEKTRPPTEEEIKKRLEWFNKEWKKLEEKEPEFEKALLKGKKKFEEELSKKPPPPHLKDFFLSVFKLIRLIVKEGINTTKPLARDYFSKAPVVVEAGFIVKRFDGSSYTLKIDYGKQEEWKRFPSDGVYFISSASGRYVALLTEDDFGKIRVFRLDEDKPVLLFEQIGTTPFAFSPSGNYFAYATPDRSSIVVVNKEGNPVWNIPVKYKTAKRKEDTGPIKIALSENRLGIISWIGIKIVNLKSGEEREIRLRGGKSILFNRNGNRIYANTPGEIYIYDLESLSLIKKLDYFYLKKRGFYVQYLASLSPDERFIAGLYDPSSFNNKVPLETSVLVIYDLERDEVIKRFENLENITGGLGGVFLPASFSEDWSYLLLIKKGDVFELFKITKEE